MKKIYLLLLTAFVATISMAQVVPPTNTRPVSQNGFLPVDNILLQQGQSMANIFKAPSDNPITQQPEGTNYTNVNRSGRGYYNSVLGVDFGEYTCTLGEYVVGNDNNVYIKNPFSQQRTNSYLKLERLSGDTLIARLPQAIDTKNGEKTFAMRMVMKMLDDEHFTYSPDTLSDKTIASDMKFIMRNDSIIQLSDGKEEQYGRPKTILGEMSEDGYWTGFGDDEEIWSLIKETATTLPEGLTIEDYQLRYAPTDSTLSSQMVKVAFDDKNIYISNLSQGNEWVKGEIMGNKAVFKQQYLGRDEKENCHVYFIPTTFTLVNHYSNYEKAEELTFDYNAGEKSLTAPEGTSMFVCAGKVLTPNNKLAAYDNPVLTKFTEKPATPAAPIIRSATPDETGWGGSLEYIIKAEDVDGNYISQEKLYYCVYFDEDSEPYTFVDADGNQMTEIPCNYVNGTSFFYVNGTHYIVSLMKTFNRVGIAEIYKGGGETHMSETTWYEVTADGLKAVETSDNVKSVTYYTLSGMQVSKPANGLFIQVTTFADGKQKSIKIAR